MATPMTEDEIRERARKRVDMKMGFYIHALVFVCVNLGMYVLNLYTGGQRWFAFPLFGWGLGLAIHGIVTVVSLRGDGLRERMMDAEIERLKTRR